MTKTFSELNLSPQLLEAVEKLGFSTATPVQEQSIPSALDGRDIIAAAQTGTGKTAAFTFPIMDRLAQERSSLKGKGPFALVLTPTRELAQQITEVARTVGETTGLSVQNVVGGKKYEPQIEALEKGCDILIATPGRLIDLMDRKAANLSNVRYYVLDEADRMLDMGFWPSVHRITNKVPKKRQTLFFSATLTKDVMLKAETLLDNPVSVQISTLGETADTVDEFVMPVEGSQKADLLKALLEQRGGFRVLVFTRTKQGADACARRLAKANIKADSIHADRSQSQRDRALKNFRTGKINVLAATDVLARGIDVTDIDYVVNYDVPDSPEDYVHRIGRTGRAGEKGAAYTFLSPDQLLPLRDIEYFTGRLLAPYDVEGFPYREGRFVPDPKRPVKRGAKRGRRPKMGARRGRR